MNSTPIKNQLERLLSVSSERIARQENELRALRDAAIPHKLPPTTIACAVSVGILLGIGFMAIVWGLW